MREPDITISPSVTEIANMDVTPIARINYWFNCNGESKIGDWYYVSDFDSFKKTVVEAFDYGRTISITFFTDCNGKLLCEELAPWYREGVDEKVYLGQ